MDVVDVGLLMHRCGHALAKTSVRSGAGDVAKSWHGAAGVDMEPLLLHLELLPEIPLRLLKGLDKSLVDDLCLLILAGS